MSCIDSDTDQSVERSGGLRRFDVLVEFVFFKRVQRELALPSRLHAGIMETV